MSAVPMTLHKILTSFYDLKWSTQNSVLWDIMTRIIRNTLSAREVLSNKICGFKQNTQGMTQSYRSSKTNV